MSMTRRWRLIIGLLLVLAAIDAVLVATDMSDAFCIGTFSPRISWCVFNAAASLAFAQVALIAIWAGSGSRWASLGLVAMVVVGLAWEIKLLPAPDVPRGSLAGIQGSVHGYNAVLLLAPNLATIIAIWGLRLFVVRVYDDRLVRSLRDASALSRPRFQFTLAQMFAWTTAIAFSLGITNWAVDWSAHLPFFLFENPTLSVVVNSAGGIAVALAALWAAMGTGQPAFRWLLLALLCASWVVGEEVIQCGPPVAAVIFVSCLVVVVKAVFLVCPLLVFRLAGYRFGRPSRV